MPQIYVLLNKFTLAIDMFQLMSVNQKFTVYCPIFLSFPNKSMLYFLLIIIAIGVFLASKAGRSLLGILTILAIIGGLLYVGFWVVMFLIYFLRTPTGNNVIELVTSIFGFILLIGAGAWILYGLWKNKAKIPGYLKRHFLDIWNKHRYLSIFFSLIYTALLIVMIWALSQE